MRCTEDACLVSRPIKLACPAINKCQWAKWNSIFCPFHIPYWKWSIAYSVMQWSPVQQQYLWDSRPSPSIAVPCHVAEIFCFVIAVFLHCSQLCSKENDSRSIASSKLKSTYTKNIYCNGIRFRFRFTILFTRRSNFSGTKSVLKTNIHCIMQEFGFNIYWQLKLPPCMT